MESVYRRISETVTALLLAAAMALGGILLATRVTESSVYQQSMIIRTIFSGSDENLGMVSVITDTRSRGVLLKFAGSLANAYVSFELIPVNEAKTFAAVYESLGTAVGIEEFSYHRKTLVIDGTSPDENGYREFLRRLRAKEHFESVTGHFYVTTEDMIKFEIECVPAE